MKVYDESWDFPHQHNGSELWQESDWLSCYDVEQGVGIIFRIGQRPVQAKGQPSLFVFDVTGQRYLMPQKGGEGTASEIAAADRWQNGYRAAGHKVEALGKGEVRYSWKYPDTRGELVFQQQLYVPRDWSKSGKHGAVTSDMNADGHLECSGRVVGKVRIGSQEYSIDCFGHRDRSWGERDQYVSRMRRCLSAWGSVGDSLSFAAALMEFDDGRAVTTGFVVRDGAEQDLTYLNMQTIMDGDMATPLAGKVILELESGERLHVECDLKQAFGGFHPGTSFAAVGASHYAGEAGFCCYSVISNTSRGEHLLTQADVSGLALTNGLSASVTNIVNS